MAEHSIVAARASVLVYDDGNGRWVASGSSQGLSKVHIYHHTANATFRVVGRKLQDHEVVINCAILKGLKYNQATATFHQWRDNRQVYGLNFTSREDADSFAHAMLTALDTLNNGGRQVSPPQAPIAPQQSQYQMPNVVSQQQQAAPQIINVQQNGPTPASEEEERLSKPAPVSYQTHQRSGSKGNSQGVYMGSGTWPAEQQSSASNVPQAPPLAPPVQKTPVAAPPTPAAAAAGVPPAPPPPPPPAAPGPGVPPAPPPLPPAGDAGKPPLAPATMISDGTLACALKTATLRKTNKQADDEGGNGGTLGRSGMPSFPGSGDMMTEMAQKLKQRRIKAEEGDGPPGGAAAPAGNGAAAAAATTKPWEKSTSNQNNSSMSSNGSGGGGGGGTPSKTSGPDSPRLSRSKRFQSLTGQENFSQFAANNNASMSGSDLEVFKLEILAEVKREIQRAKLDIIEAVKQELSKR